MIRTVQPRYILGLVFAVSVALASQSLKAAEPVTLLLRWDHQFQFAGYYAALWKGYYSDAGLEVTIRTPFKEGKGIFNSVDEVVSGGADFGIGGADLLIALDQEKPVVVVGTYFHESAVEFFIDRRAEYTSLTDLPRLRVGRRIGDLLDTEFQAMLLAEGIDPDTVKPAAIFGGESNLADESLDLIPGYSFVTPILLKNKGVDYTSLKPKDYGIQFYGDSLFTRQDLIDSKVDAVNNFVTATRRGWEYALDNPEEIADLIATKLKRRFPVADPIAFNRAQIEGVKKLTLYPLVEPGHINPGRWQHMHDWLQKTGMVTKPIDLGAFIHDPLIKKEAFERLLIQILTVLFGVVVVLGAISWIWLLRRAVATRTIDLTSNIEQRKRAENALQVLNEGLEQKVENRTTELRNAQDELLRKERMSSIGQITATVSHELRNPLGAIRSGIDVIKSIGNEESPQMKRAVALIDRAEGRCNTIIADLLDFTRVRRLDRVVKAVDDWLAIVLDEYHKTQGMSVRRELNAGVSIDFDHERLRRVMVNVMDNACQAVNGADNSDGEASSAEITVTTQVAEDRLEIAVSDNGPGIAPDDLKRVFEPLYTTKSIGVGLGLPLVRLIMEQHGGGVEITSEIGHGTDLVLWLPLQSST